MFVFGDKNAIAMRLSRSYRSFKGKATGSFHPAPHPSTGLVVDSKGVITDCSDDLLLEIGAAREQVIGNKVRSLIPSLPFQAATEGYNIAYATFAAARNESRKWIINAADGRRIEVTGRITIRRLPGSYAIGLTIVSSIPRIRVPQHEGRAPRSEMTHVAALCASSNGTTSRRRVQAIALRPAVQMQALRRGSRVRLMLDSKYRIEFASSAVEDLFGIDYEQVVGVPASVLLPDLQNHLGPEVTLRNARTSLQKMGPFVSHARHANGHAIPVKVSLQEGSADRIAALQLEVALY